MATTLLPVYDGFERPGPAGTIDRHTVRVPAAATHSAERSFAKHRFLGGFLLFNFCKFTRGEALLLLGYGAIRSLGANANAIHAASAAAPEPETHTRSLVSFFSAHPNFCHCLRARLRVCVCGFENFLSSIFKKKKKQIKQTKNKRIVIPHGHSLAKALCKGMEGTGRSPTLLTTEHFRERAVASTTR